MSHKDIKQIVLFLVHYMVYSFNFSTGNQYLQYCIRISTPVSLASFVQPTSLIAKSADQQKSQMELETKALGTISLIDA